jgi:hypothetical protein
MVRSSLLPLHQSESAICLPTGPQTNNLDELLYEFDPQTSLCFLLICLYDTSFLPARDRIAACLSGKDVPRPSFSLIDFLAVCIDSPLLFPPAIADTLSTAERIPRKIDGRWAVKAA